LPNIHDFERTGTLIGLQALRVSVTSDIRYSDIWLALGLAFVGGYCDAASFVLAKTFTGHVTGNLVIGAIAVAALDWRALVGPLSAIVTFLAGIVLSTLTLWE
jgi:uncharacterized membrane protein YoaK (UPF0700 family)